MSCLVVIIIINLSFYLRHVVLAQMRTSFLIWSSFCSGYTYLTFLFLHVPLFTLGNCLATAKLSMLIWFSSSYLKFLLLPVKLKVPAFLKRCTFNLIHVITVDWELLVKLMLMVSRNLVHVTEVEGGFQCRKPMLNFKQTLMYVTQAISFISANIFSCL